MDYFDSWLNQEENRFFWNKALPSETLDKVLADSKMQYIIANNSQHRDFYTFIETTIIKDYAELIDTLLRNAVHKLPLNDFVRLKGFEDAKQMSPEQTHYFAVRKHIQYFVIQDIQQHQNIDAQLSAFRRWIDIADQLEKKGCYEGLALVFSNLSLMEKPHLLEGLPKCTQNTFERLRKLTCNKSALREQIKNSTSKNPLYAVYLWLHDLIHLKESIAKAENQEQQLRDEKKSLKRELRRERSAEMILRLIDKRNKNDHNLQTAVNDTQGQRAQRNAIYTEIAQQLSIPAPRTMRRNKWATYQVIVDRYNKASEDDRSYPSPRNSPRKKAPADKEKTETTIPASNLYSKQLLPSFFARKGKTAEKYWQQVFSVSNGPNK